MTLANKGNSAPTAENQRTAVNGLDGVYSHRFASLSAPKEAGQ